MSIDTQELRSLLERMTPGEWRVLRDQCHFDTASDIVCGSKTIAQTCSKYPQLEHDAAGIVALKNAAPVLLDEIERLRAALEQVVGDCDRCGGTGSHLVHDLITGADLWEDCGLCSLARAALGEKP